MKNWKLQIIDRLARLTLNAESAGNRLTPAVFSELNEVLRSLDLKQLRGLILENEGEDFSQGFDLSTMLSAGSGDPEYLEKVFETCNQALDNLYRLAIPTMTIIKGSCVGGGLLIAMATDFRIADPEAKFGFPEVNQSLVVNLGLKRVYSLIGEPRTKELVLRGKPVSAQTMFDWGVINKIMLQSEFEEEVNSFIKYIHSTPPLAVRANKELIQKLSELSFDESVKLENKLQLQVLNSNDFSEAISSFLEKRHAVYQGK